MGVSQIYAKFKSNTSKQAHRAFPNDIVILVIGPVGVGKSSFINALAGRGLVDVGHGLEPCTTALQPVVIEPSPLNSKLLSERRLVMVDTPGIASSYASDQDIIGLASEWLLSLYGNQVKFGGVVCLQDISQTQSPVVTRADVFLRVLGMAFDRIILAITKSEFVVHAVAQRRTDHLKNTSWKDMIAEGSEVHQLTGDSVSAWRVVDVILGRHIESRPRCAPDIMTPHSIVIPVMGLVGVGKSTFINTLAGCQAVEVAKSPQPCTRNLEHVVILPVPKNLTLGGRLILVDTPGFVDNEDDSRILQCIMDWLASFCKADMKLGGIIYLQDISQNFMPKVMSCGTFQTFGKLCGEERLEGIVLATTKWANVSEEVGDRLQKEVISCLWGEEVKLGAQVYRFRDTNKSAQEMVVSILDRLKPNLFQVEIPGFSLFTPDTTAGRDLCSGVEQLLKILRHSVEDARDDSKCRALADKFSLLNAVFQDILSNVDS